MLYRTDKFQLNDVVEFQSHYNDKFEKEYNVSIM